MYTTEVTIQNKLGLHARPVARLVAFAQQFSSKVLLYVKDSGAEANVKSVISVMSAGASCGKVVELVIQGEDEGVAGPQIAHFIETLED